MKTRFIYCLLFLLPAIRSARAEFGFNELRTQAETLSTRPFQPAPPNPVPEALLNLDFEHYDAIHFNDQKALWRGENLPFCLEFFLPGFWHKQTVALHEITGQEVRDINFDPRVFDNAPHNPALPPVSGYAGFRIVHYDKVFDEVAAFLDATYFRMIGRGQNYGSSARGLALNTVSSQSEEFPVFRQFWIQRPAKEDREVTVYALMDSPSVTGAYRFIIRPGETTLTEVKATVFPRRELKDCGIAPLTSMFLYGENSHPPFGDFRPQVHDADGLLIHNGHNEWLWRPLEAGKMTRVDAFQDDGLHGFGLIQRDRNFEHYQDLNARFQSRPSVWVQPLNPWGKGALELVELASDLESSDNIAAFWVPAEPLRPGHPLDLEYQLHWTTNDPAPPELGRVTATRIGLTVGKPPHLRFVIEFGGAGLEKIPAGEKLSADIAYGAGAEPVTHDLFKNEINHGWRLVVEIMQPRQAVNLRANLKQGDHPLTETWNFTWQP